MALIVTSGSSRIASQLVFPATQNPSTDPNALDDYEEGEWTPAIGDDSLDGSEEGQVYAIQVGRYTKIGNMVFFQGRMNITNLGTLTTAQGANLMGLPFTSSPTTNNWGGIVVTSANSLNITAGQVASGRIAESTAYVLLRLWDDAVGATPLLISELSAGGDLAFFGAYQV